VFASIAKVLVETGETFMTFEVFVTFEDFVTFEIFVSFVFDGSSDEAVC
jgi:hypothetical protein